MAELVWHIEAISDLHEAVDHIAQDSPAAAARFTLTIVEAVERLVSLPRLGRTLPEIGDESFRELIFGKYRLVYRVLDELVVVIGVIHAAMDMDRQVRDREWELT